MRTSVLFMVVVAAVMTACAVEDPTPQPTQSQHLFDSITGSPLLEEIPEDVCALAAQLPSGDICALMCNPDAMKAQLRAEGEPAGTCLEFSCGLPDDTHVIVGVCLPPG